MRHPQGPSGPSSALPWALPHSGPHVSCAAARCDLVTVCPKLSPCPLLVVWSRSRLHFPKTAHEPSLSATGPCPSPAALWALPRAGLPRRPRKPLPPHPEPHSELPANRHLLLPLRPSLTPCTTLSFRRATPGRNGAVHPVAGLSLPVQPSAPLQKSIPFNPQSGFTRGAHRPPFTNAGTEGPRDKALPLACGSFHSRHPPSGASARCLAHSRDSQEAREEGKSASDLSPLICPVLGTCRPH